MFLRATYSTAVLIVAIGLLGAVWGLCKALSADPSGLAVMLAALCVAATLTSLLFRIRSTLWFLSAITICWLLSRTAVVLLFSNFVLTGDEAYFHQFVSKLPAAMAANQISGLSNIYDFPVWLSRSFPFCLPLAYLFGSGDVVAFRILNVLLGTAQLILVFFIVRRIAGGRAARLGSLLLLIFPYHWVNVLSYDPQIAGTFFLLLAVGAFLLLSRKVRSTTTLISVGATLAISLFLAGIQRGGVDLLLVAVLLLAIPFYSFPKRNLLACGIAVVLLWLPLRYGFDRWVTLHDAGALRSHTLGFMTRGWNLVSSGEYLPLYEQLDISAAKPEKQRTLEAVLITEFSHQPVRSLLFLAPVKIAKFFAIGYASTAEEGLSQAGYSDTVRIYRCLRAIYAPLILCLCLLGLIRCWRNTHLQRRLILPVLLVVVSCLAITLIWETSPRYSHPIHFAILTVACIGMMGLAKPYRALQFQPRLALNVAWHCGGVAMCWLLVSAFVVGVARSATSYQFLDARSIQASLDRKSMQVEPLHSFSSSWEGVIRIPPGTVLPATAHVTFPIPQQTVWDHLSVSVWLLDGVPNGNGEYQVSCQTGKSILRLPAAASGRILRVEVPHISERSTFTLSITSADGHMDTGSGIRVGIGYALAN